mmetsp:Transcript_13760/g.47844  ORF Transcript_13760/g.47844 Transcript_13760/m.47844 type:complete len:227 (+) Transcript_13760:425-1105(+)
MTSTSALMIVRGKASIESCDSPARIGGADDGNALEMRRAHIFRCSELSSTSAVLSPEMSTNAHCSVASSRTRGSESVATTSVGVVPRRSVPPSATALATAMGNPSPALVLAPWVPCARRPSVAAMQLSLSSPSARRRSWPGPATLRTSKLMLTTPSSTGSTRIETEGGSVAPPYLMALLSRLSAMILTRSGSRSSDDASASAAPSVGSKTTSRPASERRSSLVSSS